MNALVVTLTHVPSGQTRREIWDPHLPYLVHAGEPSKPLRYAIERIESGFRARSLFTPTGTWVPTLEIKDGACALTSSWNLSLTNSFRFPALSAAAIAAAIPHIQDLPISIPTQNPEDLSFERHSQRILGILALLSILLTLWPTTKEEKKDELIPPQVAKIILAKPKAKQDTTPTQASAEGTSKKEKSTAVQAFRSKMLQSAVKGLLKGGVTKLLRQSSFVAGLQGRQGAGQVFKSSATGLQALAPLAGFSSSVRVGQLGGYGSGTKAGIQGQGKGFVALELGESLVEEGLTQEEVGKVIHSHMSEIRYCYEQAMLRDPSIEGRMSVHFTINGRGTVSRSSLKETTLGSPALEDCILRRLGRWAFPKPKGGIDVAVTYPFLFKAMGR